MDFLHIVNLTAYMRNAEDSVPYRTYINHITLYKWQVPCRGQAPRPTGGCRQWILLHIVNLTAYMRNAEDSVPYRTIINHIIMYKWQMRCCGAPGSSRPTGLVVIFTFINHITYMQSSTAMPGASPRPTGRCRQWIWARRLRARSQKISDCRIAKGKLCAIISFSNQRARVLICTSPPLS